MNFPIDLSFKILAIASQIYVRDASGTLIGYVKQKLFKLREDINVFTDESQTEVQYNIQADRIIDFSAGYIFRDRDGAVLGAVKRDGMRSLWRARYQIFDSAENPVMHIAEENPWVRVIDSVVNDIPFIGMLSGYMFHPVYLVSRMDDQLVARLKKEPAFFESKFQLSAEGHMDAGEEQLVLLSVLTMALLERARG